MPRDINVIYTSLKSTFRADCKSAAEQLSLLN